MNTFVLVFLILFYYKYLFIYLTIGLILKNLKKITNFAGHNVETA